MYKTNTLSSASIVLTHSQRVDMFSLSVFYLSQNNKLDRTQVQRTYEVFSYIQFYNNTKHAK
jgi:hypothetical protein